MKLKMHVLMWLEIDAAAAAAVYHRLTLTLITIAVALVDSTSGPHPRPANETQTQTQLEKCWTSCRCYSQCGIYSILCVRAALRAIPNSMDELDFYPQIFNFSGNRLKYVGKETFRGAHLRTLEIVDLSDNGITKVASSALANMRNLLEIDLSRNELRTVRAKMFRNNRFLNTIRLSGNPIRELGEHAFALSVYLKTLDLQGCKLTKIHRYAFVNTPLLENLNLKDNALTSPPLEVLHLTRLRALQLDGNPWKCDARLWRVLEWLRRRKRRRSQSLLCVFGETDDAVFWDTMEVSKVEKFQKPTRRPKRAISGHGHGHGHKTDKIVNHTQPITGTGTNVIVNLVDVNGTGTGCTQQFEYSPTSFLDNLYKPKAIPPNSAAVAFVKSPSRFAYNNVKIARNYVQQSETETETRKLRRASANKFDKNDADDATSTSTSTVELKLPSSSPLLRLRNVQQDYNDNDKGDQNRNQRSGNSYQGTEDSTNDNSYDDDDNFIQRNHVAILCLELILIAILLFILHQLWTEKRKRYPSGINTPLNKVNGGVQIKTYDTQISCYKRYSLSDEEYSNIRNTTTGGAGADEGKYDAESGYLSYHRYNSIEGENTTVAAAIMTTTTSNYDHRATLYFRNKDDDDDDDDFKGNSNIHHRSQGNLTVKSSEGQSDRAATAARGRDCRTLPRRLSQRERKRSRQLSSLTNTNTNTDSPK